MSDDTTRRLRWRLLLGEDAGLNCPMSGQQQQCDKMLGYLYDRGSGSSDGQRNADLSPSQLSVPEWINGIHELFPKRTVERLEKDDCHQTGSSGKRHAPKNAARAISRMQILDAQHQSISPR